MTWRGLIDGYREFLPVTDSTPAVTLYEGNTPLLPAPRLAQELGIDASLFVKYEGMNPTGSFKDRGMTLAVSKALESGSKAVMCASTGNTSASAAAYAARCGMQAIVLIPEGAIALGKLAQAVMEGAQVIAVQGNFDDALRLVREMTQRYPITLVNSVNPFRIEGQKTAAFEIVDALGQAPDVVAIPVGNAGNITAYWKGFTEYHRAGKAKNLPKMMGFQAAGAAPIVLGAPVAEPETVATAIRIGNPASWEGAVKAADCSNGLIDSVTDEEILAAYRVLAQTEGVFCEPGSAASVAGVKKMWETGRISAGDTVVCVLTGHGLKDPDNAIAQSRRPTVVPAEIGAVEVQLGLKRLG